MAYVVQYGDGVRRAHSQAQPTNLKRIHSGFSGASDITGSGVVVRNLVQNSHGLLDSALVFFFPFDLS